MPLLQTREQFDIDDCHGDRARALPEDQVTFPVTGNRAIVGFGRPFTDVDEPRDRTLAIAHALTRPTTMHAPAAQVTREFLAQGRGTARTPTGRSSPPTTASPD